MKVSKAHGLVDSILRTHADAVGATSPEARSALDNARLDLHGLVEQIIDECRAEMATNRETTARPPQPEMKID